MKNLFVHLNRKEIFALALALTFSFALAAVGFYMQNH